MTRDVVFAAVIVVAFAGWLTAHTMLALGFVRRRPRWRALVALVVLPLAPYWGWRSGMRVRTAIWVLSGAVYLVAVLAGGR